MSEVEAVVQVIFFLISTIILQAGYIADVALLGVLYLLLPHCSNHPNRQSSRPSVFKGTKAAHAIFIFILSAIWLSAMGLKIQYQVGRVIGDPSGLYYHTLPNIHKLNGTYNILYFFGALEVLVWSILGFIDTKKRKASGQLQIILLGLVAGPLFLRSIYFMAVSINQDLQQHDGSRRLALASDIIGILTTLTIYAGIVAICWRIARANPPPPDPDHINPSYDPNYWAANGNQLPNRDPKNPMAVHETAPPVYQQHPGYQTTPQQGGYYAPQPPAPQQFQQPLHQPYANQQPPPPQQQHYQTPYQVPGSAPYQPPYRGAASPPPAQQPYGSPSASPVHHQPQHTHTMTSSGPSEMNASSVSELSSSTHQHAR
ncbi:MAG: hypothetical protein LQ346_002143 [Caloplaca aetnensis]|nr:MAG: hypothetical protein LQ346_002143 [Caloplaca aetnensis]